MQSADPLESTSGSMRWRWVALGAVLLLATLAFAASHVLEVLDFIRGQPFHLQSQLVAQTFGPFDGLMLLASAFALTQVTTETREERTLLSWALVVGLAAALLLAAISLYSAIDPVNPNFGGGPHGPSLSSTTRASDIIGGISTFILAALAAWLFGRMLARVSKRLDNEE